MRRVFFTPALLAGLTILCGCGERDAATESTTTAEVGEAMEMNVTLPLPKRLAFMTGHVEAGLALYRAGELKMAAPHLLHPVSETHAAEREGLDAHGFDAALFEFVAKALDAGKTAEAIEPELLAAKKNLEMVASRAGGDTLDIINFLLDTIVEEYEIGVRDGEVTDIGEYQDAFGFTVVAIQRADRLSPELREPVIDALQSLLANWPAAPIPPSRPVDAEQIKSQVLQVRALLNAS